MSSPYDQPSSVSGSDAAGLAQQLKRKVRRARLVIALNRIWPAVWLPLAVAGLFLLLSLVGFWSHLPHSVHKGMLWAFGAALVIAFVPLIRVRWPSRAEGLRHLEMIAGLPHRPATSYHDGLSETPSPGTRRLWTAHRERMAKMFASLRTGWPHPRVDMRDPFALRILLLLLLATTFIANREEAYDRVKAAFVLNPVTASATARLDAWVTPPVYTGKPPIMLADGARQLIAEMKQTDAVTAPFKSELTVRVNHPDGSRFSLRVSPASGEPETLQPAFTQGKESTAEFKKQLTADAGIELLEDSAVVMHWAATITPDNPPRITLTEPLSEAQRGSIKLRYKVEDDYGVLSAEAQIERADDPEDEAAKNRPADVFRLGKPPSVPLTLPRANTKEGQGQTYRDLTSHFWAGLPVGVTLAARDQAGQIGRSETVPFTLPERQFTKPLARALIEQRKLLVDRPDRKDLVAKALNALTIAPETFTQDTGLYTAMRAAYWRLRNTTDRPDLESAADLLWSIAVHIEDGDLSDAERQLRAAQEDLMKALDENAPDEEIKRLMDELRTALSKFLESMAKQAMQNPNFDPRNPISPNRVVTSKDLERMLKQIEDLARTGSKDAARQMLSELRDILENAQNGRQQAQNGDGQEMMNMLDGLSDLIGKQQQLLDETYRAQQRQERGDMSDGDQEGQQGQQGQRGRQGQQGQGQKGRQGQRGQQGQKGQQGQQGGPGQNGENPFPGLGQRQGEIEKALREMMDKLRGMGANPPDQLDGAGQAMGKAGEALGQENGDRASQQETLALDKLRQGAKSMAEQMMNGMGQQGRANANGSRDPLGRPMPTQQPDPGDSVKVPEEADVQRAREILDELRRRLGEATRPPQELDYIDRLIERF